MARRKTTKKAKREPMPGRGASDREVAEFWEAHSVADYWDELEPAELTKRHKPRQVVTLRLDPQAVEALRALAQRKGINYSTLARAWIAERLRDELGANQSK
ncbi:MAG: CopG family antitoxin [Myxococcota bacterium]